MNISTRLFGLDRGTVKFFPLPKSKLCQCPWVVSMTHFPTRYKTKMEKGIDGERNRKQLDFITALKSSSNNDRLRCEDWMKTLGQMWLSCLLSLHLFLRAVGGKTNKGNHSTGSLDGGDVFNRSSLCESPSGAVGFAVLESPLTCKLDNYPKTLFLPTILSNPHLHPHHTSRKSLDVFRLWQSPVMSSEKYIHSPTP